MESITDVDVGGGYGGIIDTDRACSKCDYNLRGLRYGARCPECGVPIRRRGSSRFVDNLTSAPMWYLRFVAAGLGLMTLATAGHVVWSIYQVMNARAWTPIPFWQVATTEIAVAVIWLAGVAMVLIKRPIGDDTIRDAILDMRGLRQVAIGMQATFPLSTAAGLAAVMLSASWLGVVSGMLSIAFLFGTIPLCVYLSSLADWAGDTGVGSRLRTSAWIFAVCGSTVVVGVALLAIPSFPAHFLVLIVTVLCAICTMIGVVLFVVGMLQLTSCAMWAMQNSVSAKAREIRILERREREEEEKHRRYEEQDASLRSGPDVRAEPLGALPEAFSDDAAIPLEGPLEEDAGDAAVDAAIDAAAGRVPGVQHRPSHVTSPGNRPPAERKPMGSHKIDRASDGVDPYELAPDE